ncbi:hypothetical protein GCM10007301_53190 [Azorhizobium oxalatiphilum]|uniref:Uncharacterized protein n=1 Tax=Azorhizobium oxalatiphilum TaxID=980631 RepID=A0A917CH31_9HYPH|nr:hypothetical protein GCM10007301_53190 [Azorhizobium oxalatiphilum]
MRLAPEGGEEGCGSLMTSPGWRVGCLSRVLSFMRNDVDRIKADHARGRRIPHHKLLPCSRRCGLLDTSIGGVPGCRALKAPETA